MLSQYILLIVLPAVAYCRIDIRIRADTDMDKSSVDFMGEDIAIISDQEREAFKLDDKALKDASYAYVGRACTDMYLKRPTPWADVYKKFNWAEVQRTLKPVRAKILSIKSQPVAVAKAEYVNNSNKTASYKKTLTQEVADTVGHSWSSGGKLTVEQKINYSVGIGATGSIGGSTSMSYAASWGKENKKEEVITLGATSNVEVELPPKHGATATLMSTRGTMEIEVEYEATVDGDVFCNHHGGYKGHMWWAYPLSALQNIKGLPKTVKTIETISVGFYTTVRIELRDLEI